MIDIGINIFCETMSFLNEKDDNKTDTPSFDDDPSSKDEESTSDIDTPSDDSKNKDDEQSKEDDINDEDSSMDDNTQDDFSMDDDTIGDNNTDEMSSDQSDDDTVDSETPMEEEPTEDVTQKMKKHLLIKSFNDLYNDMNLAIQSLNKVSIESDEEKEIIDRGIKDIKELKELLYTYLEIKFNKDDYANSMYTLMHFKDVLIGADEILQKIKELRQEN